MTAEAFLISLLNGVSYGLLLFMLSAGLTLIFSLMGVLNFAHASFYMLGAYLGHAVAQLVGFWVALAAAPLAVGLLGAAFERAVLRPVRRHGHVPELLITFGLSWVLLELVQLAWGRAALPSVLPAVLDAPLFTLYGLQFPRSRAFIMGVALLMLGLLWWGIERTRVGLVIRAALTHPQTVQALGHDVPAVFVAVFGCGCALAALAGVIGGATYVTEPGMAHAVGAIVFVVVVVGGLGSLAGAFLASLLIGLLQSFAVAVDRSLLDLLQALHLQPASTLPAGLRALLDVRLSQVAPVLPFALLVAMLVLRPRGLLGERES